MSAALFLRSSYQKHIPGPAPQLRIPVVFDLCTIAELISILVRKGTGWYVNRMVLTSKH